MKRRVLGIPVQFSTDGTWEVDAKSSVAKQAGSLYLTATLKAIVFVEDLTGLHLPVTVYQEDSCRDDPPEARFASAIQ